MASKRLETAKKFVDHYAENDNDVLHSILADDLKYTFSPSRSLNDPKTYDKAGFIGFKEAMKFAMTGYPLDVIQYIDSESSNMVIVWATGRPQFREEVRDNEVFSKEQWEEYVGEFVFMLTMDEAGEKIIKVNEFIDSKGTDLKLWPLAARAIGNLQKAASKGS